VARWAGRAGRIVLVLLAIVVVLGINPWFALVIAPALLVAAGSAWGETRSAVRTGHPPAEFRLGRLAWRAGLVIGLAVVGLAGVLLTLRSQAPSPEPPRPSIDLPATYVGAFSCSGRCTKWTADHVLTVTLAAGRTELVDMLAAGLATHGWRLTKPTAVDDEVRLLFDLSGPAQSTPIGWWPIRTTGTLALPEPIPTGEAVATLPAGPEAAALAGRLSRDALARGLDIYLGPRLSSALTLTYPRLAVSATAPASDPHDIAGDRQERVLHVGGVTDATVALDLLSPVARSDGAAKFAALGTGGWGWLLVTSLSGLLIKRVRTSAAAFARSVLERIRRRRQPPRRAGRTRGRARSDTTAAGRRGPGPS